MNTFPPTIHLVRTSAFADNKLQLCLDTIAVNDELILLDDGVYNINHALLSHISNVVYVIAEHLSARGITATDVKIIDYVGLVKATTNAGKVITWQ